MELNLLLIAVEKLFSKSLKYKPFLIKPNKDELKEYAKREFKNNQEIIDYVRKNLVDKAEHIIISLGGRRSFIYR